MEDACKALGAELWQVLERLELRLAEEKRAFETTLGAALEADADALAAAARAHALAMPVDED